MSELYLILHKVRGEPAFDIAQKIMIGGEEGWIIPTSGHRAYPHLANLLGSLNNYAYDQMLETVGSADWDSLPDHFGTSREETGAMEELARSALLRRGLLKSKPVNNYRRR